MGELSWCCPRRRWNAAGSTPQSYFLQVCCEFWYTAQGQIRYAGISGVHFLCLACDLHSRWGRLEVGSVVDEMFGG